MEDYIKEALADIDCLVGNTIEELESFADRNCLAVEWVKETFRDKLIYRLSKEK